MQISNTNSLLFWVGRTVDLSIVTAAQYRLSVQPSKTTDPWELIRCFASWDSSDRDPSEFVKPIFKIEWPGLSWESSYQLIEMEATLNPGINDQTAGTTFPKQFFYKSPRIGKIMPPRSSFNFFIENFLGTGKPDTIDLLFEGRRITKQVH